MSKRTCRSCYIHVSFAMIVLSGCSTKSFQNPTNLHLDGVAMGGQQPISGALQQLYAVSATGTGAASTPLLTVTVTSSDGSGNSSNANANAGNAFNSLPMGYFTITNDYTCPSAGAQVYLTSTGGNPGLAAGTNNTDIAIMAALGACGQLSASTFVRVNEDTTVGSIAALFPYMTAYNAVGSTAGNTDYLAEEFSVATEYMNAAMGAAPGANLPAGFYASSNEVNTLANLVATCVNTGGGAAGDGTACGNILLAAKPPGGTAPTDTVGLVLDILKNPTNNVGGIYSYIGTTPQFFPYDLSAPSDWTLPILPLPQTPFATPAAGAYAGAQSVTLTSPTSGATIYYTTDGTAPTTSSSVYSSAIAMSASGTLTSMASNRAGTSAMGTNAYTITGAAAMPVISLAAGTYTSIQNFSVRSTTADAAVYVTTDGTTPTSSSMLVTGPLQLLKTETVKAIAIAGGVSSGIASAAYTYSPTSGTINTLAGGATGDGLAAISGEIGFPSCAAVDGSGNLYIADAYDQTIRKVTASTGIITTVAGNGAPGFAGDGGAATSAEVNSPRCVTMDGSGNLYIADASNNRIRKVTASTGIITTVAGNGAQGYVAAQDGGAATSAELYYPTSVAVDGSGNLYIADRGNNLIRKVTVSTGIITTVAGNGTQGYVAAQDGGAATSAELNTPSGVAVDASQNLFIADTLNHRIRKVTASTGFITTVAGTGTGGYVGAQDGGAATSAELNAPISVVVDASGSLYIADASNNRIRKVTASTGIITTVAGTGTAGYIAAQDGGPATSAEVNLPYGATVDGSGNLYIADSGNSRVRKVMVSTGIITTVAGTGSQAAGYVAAQDGGAAINAVLNFPYGAAVDGSGNLYIADSSNNRIRKVTASTGIITTVAGNGTAGYTGDGGAATSAELNVPTGVAVDASGNLYIADSINNRIRKVTASTGIITTVAGTGLQGYTASQDGGPATSAKINQALGVTVDGSGNLYIADSSNNRIRKVTASTGIITTVAGNGTGAYVAAQDGGAATNAEIFFPRNVAVDGSGNLYIADTGNSRIRLVTASTGIITTVAGNGTAGYVAAQDGGAATSAEISFPSGVAVDGSGNLYIGDRNNNRIRKVTASTGIITTVAGTGTGGYVASQDGGPATSAEINIPTGIAVDGSGNLYFADTSNSRIRVVYP